MSFLNRSSLTSLATKGTGANGLLSKTQEQQAWPYEPRLEQRDHEERVRKTVAVQRWRGLIS